MLESAFNTTIMNNILIAFNFNTNRLHSAVTFRPSIARINVDVLRP